MQIYLKEARFDLYCKKCKYENLEDYKEPCNTCLEQCWSEEGGIPLMYEAKDTKGSST